MIQHGWWTHKESTSAELRHLTNWDAACKTHNFKTFHSLGMCQSGVSVSIKIKMNAALQHVKNYIYCWGPEICHHVRYEGFGKWLNTVYQILRKKIVQNLAPSHSKSKETSPNYFNKVVSTIVKKQNRGAMKNYQSKTTHMVVTYICPCIFKLWSLLKRQTADRNGSKQGREMWQTSQFMVGI